MLVVVGTSLHPLRSEYNVYMGTRAKSSQRQMGTTTSCAAPRANSIRKYTDPTGSRARGMQRAKNTVKKTVHRSRSSQCQNTPVVKAAPVKGILRNTTAAADPVFKFRPSSVHSAEERRQMKLFGLLRVPNCVIL